MIVAAAVDIREGRCVQWVGGDPQAERVSLPSPLAAAQQWREQGFTHLHVVDLDAALGRGSNRGAIVDILSRCPGVQVGGGVRSTESAVELTDAGADRVIVGTRALAEPDWLRDLADKLPGRIVAAADVRGTQVVVKGWTESSQQTLVDVLAGWEDVPLGGVLVTDVGREGRLQGLDAALATRARQATRHPLWLAGGVRDIEDLRLARAEQADAVVLGMSLYTGAFDLPRVWREFPQQGAAT